MEVKKQATTKKEWTMTAKRTARSVGRRVNRLKREKETTEAHFESLGPTLLH